MAQRYLGQRSGTMGEDDPVIQLLQESILHLCRANSLNLSGEVEIDGIVCISNDKYDHQIVVKVHEKFHNDVAPQPATNIMSQTMLSESTVPHHRENVGRGASRKRKHKQQLTKSKQVANKKETEIIEEADTAPRLLIDNCASDSSNGITVKLENDDYETQQMCGLLDKMRKTADFETGADEMQGSHFQDSLPCWMSPSIQSSLNCDTEEGVNKCQSIEATYLSSSAGGDSCGASQQQNTAETTPITSGKLEKKIHNYGSQKGAFPCPYCEKIFGWQRTLLRHVNKHVDNRPYVCKYCNKAFHRRDFLRYHVITHLETDPHKCGICKKTFALRKSTFAHMKKFHNVTNCQPCSFCFAVFPADEIDRHIEDHNMEDLPMLPCPDCSYTSKSPFQMMEHSIHHFPTLEPDSQSNSVLSEGSLVAGTDVDWCMPTLSPGPSDTPLETPESLGNNIAYNALPTQ